MKIKKILISLGVFFSLFFDIYGQLNVNFSMDVTSGCVPFYVNITNNTTGPLGETIYYNWTFGDGDIKNTDSPTLSKIYSTSGNFQLKLIAFTLAGLRDSFSINITAFKPPVADYTTSAKVACTPYTMQFSDASVLGDAPIKQYYWDFRDGYPDTTAGKNISKLYTAIQTYDIFYKVTDNNGCSSIKVRDDSIKIVAHPVLNLVSNTFIACDTPYTVDFSNRINVDNDLGLNYKWTFGNGDSSSLRNPGLIVYKTFNDFKFTIKADNAYGCIIQSSGDVFVRELKAEFTAEQNSLSSNNNDTICPGNISFKDVSTAPVRLWYVNNKFETTSPEYIYAANSGSTASIRMIAIKGLCRDSIDKTFYVDSVQAKFSIDAANRSTCSLPYGVNVKDSSLNISKYYWYYNDNKSVDSINKNPSPIILQYPSERDTFSHVSKKFVLDIKLEGESLSGCKSTAVNSVEAQLPVAWFMPDKTHGCAPLTVVFSDSSVSKEKIIQRQWEYGDGVIESGTDSVRVHTFVNPGEYTVRLIVQNINGCIDTSYNIYIHVGNVLKPNFSVAPTPLCAGGVISLTDLTVGGSGNIDTWHYSSPAMIATECNNNPNPTAKINPKRSGLFPVKLEIDYNGCISDTTIENAIEIKSAIPYFEYEFDCDSSYTYNFNQSIDGAVNSWSWNFGDGSPIVTIANPTHQYTASGKYLVTLTAISNDCSNKYERWVNVRKPKAVITSDTLFCVADSISFSASQSVDEIDSCFIASYLWSFGDKSLAKRTYKDTVSHAFDTNGVYPVRLVVYADNGCSDTAYRDIHLKKPFAEFTTTDSVGCAPYRIFYLTNTLSDTSIVNWRWELNSGEPHYNETDVNDKVWIDKDVFYTPKLIVEDIYGCIDTSSIDTFPGYRPIAKFSTANPNKCIFDSLIFLNVEYTKLVDSITWEFTNQLNETFKKTSFTDTLGVKFTDRGVYDLRMILFRSECSDTAITENYVSIQQAIADYVVENKDGVSSNIPSDSGGVIDVSLNCVPQSITFKHLGKGDSIVNDGSTWQFRVGNSGVWNSTGVVGFNYERASYSQPSGKYQTSLIARTSNGCKDTMKLDINIIAPDVTGGVVQEYACAGDSLLFKINSFKDVDNFFWKFEDNSTRTDTSFKYAYKDFGKKNITVVLSGLGCLNDTIVIDTVNIYNDKASFIFKNAEFNATCQGKPIEIENKSENVTNESQYRWSLGDGRTITGTSNPQFGYNIPGEYFVWLYTVGDHGCKDSIKNVLVVNPLPNIDVPNLVTICRDKGEILTVLTDPLNNVAWSPVAGVSNSTSHAPILNPSDDQLYTIIVRNNKSCEDTAQLFVDVIQEPNTVNSPEDTTIIIGESVQLISASDQISNYSWSPNDSIQYIYVDSSIVKVRPMNDVDYDVTIQDVKGCYPPISLPFRIKVRHEFSLHLPEAFTPNGDGANDIAYVRGWGLKELLELKIYNRWGNLVFYTNDLSQGWDGYFNGKLQSIDSYVYEIRAINFDGIEMYKKGTLMLIK